MNDWLDFLSIMAIAAAVIVLIVNAAPFFSTL